MIGKREWLARALRRCGALHALEHAGRRPGLAVLTYHRIGDPVLARFYAPVVSATPEGFREQIRRASRVFRMITLAEAVDLVENQASLDRPTALVTFDDGTRDNAEVAAPILREEGVPAAFFISPGLIEVPKLPWYDQVARIVHRATVPRIELDRPEPLSIQLDEEDRRPAIVQIVRSCLTGEIEAGEEEGFLLHLAERAGAWIDPFAEGRELFMTWNDVRTLDTNGFGVGSHGQTHRKLTLLDVMGQSFELMESKRALEARLGHAVEALAYPYGWPGAFDETTQRLARDAGYRAAFSAIEGINRPGRTLPFAIRRLNIGSSDTVVLLRARLALQTAVSWSPL